MKSIKQENFIKLAVVLIVTILISPNFLWAGVKQASEPTLDGKKVLFVYGGWKGHQPSESAEFFVPWLESEGAEVILSDTLAIYTNKQIMNSVDLIIQVWTMDKITKEQEKGLINAVKGGAGLAGWHGGIGDSFRNNVDFQFMVGGQWVSHPGGKLDYVVNISNEKDAITNGITDFNFKSEQYYMHVDPNVKVLASTRFTGEHVAWIDGAVIPVVWKKYYGDGRIFYSSLGHEMSEFSVYEVFELMKRGIRWAAESKYHPKEKWLSPVY